MALAWLIVVWDVIEGVIAVTASLAANSIALVGFGIDSAIEARFYRAAKYAIIVT